MYNPSGAIPGIPNISQDGRRLGNFGSGSAVDPFTINFTADVTAAAFAMGTVPGTTTFTALLDGVAIATATQATNATNTVNYYGFTGITFDAIRIDLNGGNNTMQLDNLQFVTGPAANVVPAPTGLVLLASGLFPSLLARRLIRSRRSNPIESGNPA